MNWEQLLSEETRRPAEKTPSSWEAYPVGCFERDYRDIIAGPLLRKLQDKLQRFARVADSCVHTRLTHSMEVSSIGKQLGSMVACNRKSEQCAVDFGAQAEMYAASFSTVLACAGLLHDIGNPPFGRFGADAIGAWFAEHLAEDGFAFRGMPVRGVLTERMREDLAHFEGSAQTIRFLLREDNGLNLTAAVCNTLVKYPADSLQTDRQGTDAHRQKYGYFLSEEKEVLALRKPAGLDGCARHPLTCLLEAADDIAYMLSVIEDSVRTGILSVDAVAAYFDMKLEEIPLRGGEEHELNRMVTEEMLNNLRSRLRSLSDEEARLDAYIRWLGYVRNWLMYAAVHAFFLHYDAIMAGTYSGELLHDSWYGYAADILGELLQERIDGCREKAAAELEGQRIVSALLDRFAPAVLHWEAEDGTYRMSRTEQNYVNLIPQRLRRAYLAERTGEPAMDLYLRFRMVVDYVASLSDADAKEVYRLLQG